MANCSVTNTLVVTSAINPVLGARAVRLTDSKSRLFQLFCSAICWLEEDAIQNIVICDSTSPDYDFSLLEQLAKRKEKSIEILTFSGSRQKVEKQGKGYGEGEILKYVLENSHLIAKCDSFYKVTGRVFVDNFDVIHKAHLDSVRVFDNPITDWRRLAKRIAVNVSKESRHGRGMVRTVFYKCDIAFFKERLLNRYREVNDKGRFYLEHAYFLPLIKSGFSTFNVQPKLVGFSGGSGELYQGLDYSQEVKEQAQKLTTATCNAKDEAAFLTI